LGGYLYWRCGVKFMETDEVVKKDVHMRRRKELILKYAQGDCLDVGCGDGYFLMEIAKRFPKNIFLGVDEDLFSINLAKQRETKNLKFIKSDIMSAKIKYKYDTIILSHVFEHLIDPANVLLKLKKLLKNDGKILLLLPNKSGFLNEARFAPGTLKHLWIFDKNSITFLLNQIGFSFELVPTTIRLPFPRRIYYKYNFLSNLFYKLSVFLAHLLKNKNYDFFIILRVRDENT